MNTQHALLIENLEIKKPVADKLINILSNFITDLNFPKNRISSLECRSRAGFIPHSHNFGGLEAIAFTSQDHMYGNGTGFGNADDTLEKYYSYDVERFEENFGIKYDQWTDEQREEFYEARSSDSESDVLFSLDIMHMGIEKGIQSINLRFCVCVKDAPYHREFDDMIEFDIHFRTLEALKKKLDKILKNKNVKQFSHCLLECY